MKLVDPDHPFFRARWRCVATVAVILVWASVEFLYASTLFGWLLLALGLYTMRVLFLPRRTAAAPAPAESESTGVAPDTAPTSAPVSPRD